ncbi:hypothetical protein BJX66DRAFT_166806 [Aspergillus keveii]|uniref:Cleavage/polyadenylation specificity factor A subunit N-terminal domain-containing protein n=1 Tax=Aspergillus keveii TaxID=714993 RepID=A0ABR4FHN6_9EURO
MLCAWSSVEVYSLENGRMHTIKQATGSNIKSKKPVVMGKNRIYLIAEDKTCDLTACDLESGEQLYSKVLGRDGTLLDFAVLYDGPSNLEQLVALEHRPDASNLQIINGANGEILQELKIDLLEFPYIAISPSRKEFALCSEPPLHCGCESGDPESEVFPPARPRLLLERYRRIPYTRQIRS